MRSAASCTILGTDIGVTPCSCRRHHSPNHRRSTRVAVTVNTTIHSATTSAPHEVGPGGSGKRAGGRIIDGLLVPALTLSARICWCQVHNEMNAHYGRESAGSRRGRYMMVISICVRVREGGRGRDVFILRGSTKTRDVFQIPLCDLRAKIFLPYLPRFPLLTFRPY